MSKEKGKRFDTRYDSDDAFDNDPEPASSAASAASAGFDFEITKRPLSKKNRKVAEALAAKAAEEAAKKEAAEAAKKMAERRQKLFAMFPQLAPKPPPLPPRPSVTCETCGAPKPEGAVGWRESELGFTSYGICPNCASKVKPRRRKSPVLVWLDQPDELSVLRDKLVQKVSNTSPNDKDKELIHGLSTLRPSSLNARKQLLMQPIKASLMVKLKKKPHGGTRRKSKSKSKSKTKSKSRKSKHH